MPAIIILPDTSTRTVKEVREEYMNDCMKRRLVTPPVPWVKIGNVYLSLFETGDESWPPIVKEITGGDKTSSAQFIVMSGRHGAPVQNQAPDFQFVGVKDEGHIGEDQNRIAKVKKEYKNLGIDVLDVTKQEYNSPLNIKTEIKKQLNGGKIVILAWCFSIFALKTAKGDMTQQGSPANLAYYANYQKRICDIVKEDWSSWVPQ